jgi:hypothetical protein
VNEALAAFLQVLTDLGLRHFAVGSVASSIHGVPRFTNDVDLLVALTPGDVDSVAAAVATDFYMDPDEARFSIRMGRAFNVLHLASAFKIDIFPVGNNGFHQSELTRSTLQNWVVPGGRPIQLPVASPEDTILSKLRWYRMGGEVSDRQWADVLGVATRNDLDWAYMAGWAPQLGVADLLERLKSEVS